MPATPYIEDGKGKRKPSAALLKVARKANLLHKKAAEIKKELDSLKTELKESIGEDATLYIPGVVDIPVQLKIETVISDEEGLRKVLGGRFDDMVTTKTSIHPSDALDDILDDEDHKLHDLVIDCVDYKESTAISFKRKK